MTEKIDEARAWMEFENGTAASSPRAVSPRKRRER